MKFFIDTNVLIDFMAVRHPHYQSAAFENQRSVAEIVGVSSSDVYKAMAEKWDDAEDSIQYQSALSAKCDCILTRNTKDFVKATIPIMTPEEFLERYYS